MILTNHKYLVHSILFDIEMYNDNIRVSQGFQNCQLLACAAERQRGGSLVLCLQYLTFCRADYLSDTLELVQVSDQILSTQHLVGTCKPDDQL